MTAIPITALPAAPNRSMAAATYISTFDTWIAALGAFVTQANALAAVVDADALQTANDNVVATAASAAAVAATSLFSAVTGSLTLANSGLVTVTLNATAGTKTFANAQRVTLMRSGAPATQMSGLVSSASMGSTPPTMGFTPDYQQGTAGTYSDWIVVFSGFQPLQSATAAQVRQGTLLTVGVTPGALVLASAFQTLTDAATIAWDASLGFNAQVTIGAVGRTMGLPTSLFDGMTYSLFVTQGASGNWTITTWNAIFDWGLPGPPTFSTAAGKTDQCFGIYSATTGKIHMNFRRSA